MREAFTETLRKVIERAQHEARQLNQEFVGTEHLMLGVLHCDTCEAAQALRQCGLERESLRAVLLAEMPRGKEPPIVTGDLPLSPKAQRVINGAIVDAQALHEQSISTRVLLLSLIDEPQTILGDVLRKSAADVEALRERLIARPEMAEN